MLKNNGIFLIFCVKKYATGGKIIDGNIPHKLTKTTKPIARKPKKTVRDNILQLAGLSKLVISGNSFKGKTVKLGANIMLNDTANWQNWASKPPANEWKPIGTYHNANVSSPFNGTFDGGGFSVSGIHINSKDGHHEGMFGYLDSNGTIKNLGVKASYIKSGDYVGGLAGENRGTIDSSYSTTFVEGAWSDVGGLVGYNADKGIVSNSHSICTVKGKRMVGGFAGKNVGKIINGHSSCAVTGEENVGGFVGSNNGYLVTGSISNSHFTGTVTGENNVGGLVGYNDERGSIISSNSDGKVTGKDMVGGLVGHSDYSSSITNSYSSGEVTGTGKVGGLVGYSYTSAITNSYSTSNVKGDSLVGGLVGLSQYSATIRNCYSAGKVIGKINAGGLVGADRHKVVIADSYYDEKTSGQNDMGKGAGRTTAQMQSKGFADSLNLIASLLSMSAWVYEANKYPVLSNELAKAYIIDGYFASGDGTEKNPYIIKTIKQFEDFSWLASMGKYFENKTIKLGASIILNDTANWQNWESKPPANKWAPIGIHSYNKTDDNSFKGTFDGNGFVVSGVYINSENDKQGLFVGIDSGGVIKNLKLTASYIKGGSTIGGLAGINSGTISDSYSSALIKGKTGVGGLVGSNGGTIINSYSSGKVTTNAAAGGLAESNRGTIINSYFSGEVTGHCAGGLACNNKGKIINSHSTGKVTGRVDAGGLIGNAGGLVGNNDEGTITGSYFNGTATGEIYVGGLAGANYGTITNSYSLGKVAGKEQVGGLVGSNIKRKLKDPNFGLTLKTITGAITYSYSACEVTGLKKVGGLVGENRGGAIKSSYYDKEKSDKNKLMDGSKTHAEMKQKSTYKGWDFGTVWGISGEVNGGYPYLLQQNQ